MRIALVTISFLPKVGGLEQVVHSLASEWCAQGHEVCVFNAITDQLPSHDTAYKIQKFNIPRSYLRLPPHWPLFRILVKQSLGHSLKAFSPDFVSVHGAYPLAIWLSRMEFNSRFLVTCHGIELTKHPWGYRRKYSIDRALAEALNGSARVVALSKCARELMQDMGVSSEKIIDIPNGVDLERFQTRVDTDFRRHLQLPGDSIVLLSVGREHPSKDFETGILAFSRVAKQFPDLYYVILGRGTRKLQSVVDKLGLKRRVVLNDGLSGNDLVAAYQQADIFFSPSIYETMPLVVLEALTCGMPLLVTNVSGSQDIVSTGQNGIVVQPGDIDGMANAIHSLASDSQLRKTFGERNRSLAPHYSWAKIGEDYVSAALADPKVL